jgi:PAS domain S-box-containing protein
MNTPQTFDLTAQIGDVSLPMSTDADRLRLERRNAAVVELSRRAIAPNVHLLVQDAAALVAESIAAERFGFAELTADRSTLEMRLATVAASEESPTGDMRADAIAARQVPLDPARSIGAFALHTAEVVAVENLANERRFNDDWLTEQNVASAVVAPLRFADESYGIIAAFFAAPREFSRDDLLYAEMIANLVSTNIARDRANKILEAERHFAATILETVDALVLVLTPGGRIVRANSACESMTGYSSEEVRDRAIWSALLVPGEADAIKGIFARLQSDPGPLLHEGFVLTKDAERRRIAWSFGLLSQTSGQIETILATGIDITEQRAAEDEIDRLQESEAASKQRLQELLEELESRKTASDRSVAARRTEAASVEEIGWQTDSNPFHPLPRGSSGDRRRRPRRSFSYFQRIAPIENGRIPPLRMFHRVKCLDISAGGFSFLSPVEPSETDYVVALGSPPVVINVAARVVHVTPIDFEGESNYLVGCEYTGRLD